MNSIFDYNTYKRLESKNFVPILKPHSRRVKIKKVSKRLLQEYTRLLQGRGPFLNRIRLSLEPALNCRRSSKIPRNQFCTHTERVHKLPQAFFPASKLSPTLVAVDQSIRLRNHNPARERIAEAKSPTLHTSSPSAVSSQFSLKLASEIRLAKVQTRSISTQVFCYDFLFLFASQILCSGSKYHDCIFDQVNSLAEIKTILKKWTRCRNQGEFMKVGGRDDIIRTGVKLHNI